jgi:hypothetical protein
LAAALGDAPYELFARVPDHGGRGLRRGKEGGGERVYETPFTKRSCGLMDKAPPS